MKITVIICKDHNDFKMWSRNRGFVSSTLAQRKVYIGDNIYLGVYQPEHLCSIMIDDIIEAPSAIQNPLYTEILYHAKEHLKEPQEVYTVKDVKTYLANTDRPPMGVKPKYLHDETRFTELRNVIKSYADDYQYINPEWITEYNELLEKLQIKKI